VSPETCLAIKKQWNNKFYYMVVSCWLFLWDLNYDARIHEHQEHQIQVQVPVGNIRMQIAVLLPLEPPPHNEQSKRRGKELAKSSSNFLAPVKGSFRIASMSTNTGAWQGVTGDYGPDTSISCDSPARRTQLETVLSLLLISDMVKTLQLRQIPDSNEGLDPMSNSLRARITQFPSKICWSFFSAKWMLLCQQH
jgi:hypothetical protein